MFQLCTVHMQFIQTILVGTDVPVSVAFPWEEVPERNPHVLVSDHVAISHD